MDKSCPDYCGPACVNGICPQIENAQYRCDDCWLYKGCGDCYFADKCEEALADTLVRPLKAELKIYE